MMTPRAMSLQGKAFGSFISLMLSSPPARMMTGIESKNEKFALPLWLNPKKSAAVIVMPDLETPGMSATACAKPIMRANFMVISYSLLFVERRSAK